MKRVIGTGIQDFEKLRMSQSFYVDKTEFIKEWWQANDDVTLFTRPRRFGKTLNMSTLNCFFSNKYENRGDLFEGLKVWEYPAMRDQQGKWPVIFLSFADVKATTFADYQVSLNQLLTKLYNEYYYMLHDSRFTDQDREMFSAVGLHMDASVAARSLQNLCDWMERYYGKKVLIFLDEYDTPLQEAYIYGFWDEITAYSRAFFNSTFKTNPSLKRGVMTGITRISKESIFSDLNNLVVVTTTSDMYASSFGFTEDEVFSALEEQGFAEEKKQEVKTWYDGFTFGNMTDIYNPWSVTNYLNEGKLDTYWANTSGNGLIGQLLRTGEPMIKSMFEILLKGGEVTVPLDEQIIYNQLDTNPNAVWSLLLATGYLKIVHAMTEKEAAEQECDRLYTLRLTNLEVRRLFSRLIQSWFAQTGGLTEFAKAMMQGDVRGMNQYLNDIMMTSMSSFDGGKKPSVKNPENFYHGLVLGLLVENKRNYMITSNRESGYGRYDVVMEPRDKYGIAAILEFKVFDTLDDEKGLEDTAKNALQQIEEKRYEKDLLSRGIPADHILKYGLAFRGKKCLIIKG